MFGLFKNSKSPDVVQDCKPKIPPVENTEEFVKWLLRYAEDMEHIRQPYKENIDKFIDMGWRFVKKDIDDHNLNSSCALTSRIDAIAETYKDFKKLVEGQGGLMACSSEFQSAAVIVMMKMSVFLYLAKY